MTPTLNDLILAAQTLVDGLKTLQVQATGPSTPVTPTEVDVKESDGSEEVFTPEVSETPSDTPVIPA